MHEDLADLDLCNGLIVSHAAVAFLSNASNFSNSASGMVLSSAEAVRGVLIHAVDQCIAQQPCSPPGMTPASLLVGIAIAVQQALRLPGIETGTRHPETYALTAVATCSTDAATCAWW